MMDGRRNSDRDSGAVLLLVLVVAIVLSLVVLALANFVAADLRYSRIVNARADTLSTAESGIDYAVARLRSKQTLCATDVADSGPVGLYGTAVPTSLPGPLNDTTTTVTCELISAGFPAVAGWSVIVTNGGQPDAIKVGLSNKDRQIIGPMYVSDPSNIDVYNSSELFSSGGDIWHRDATCATPLPPSAVSSVELQEPSARGPICTTAAWSDIVTAPPVPDLNLLPPGNKDGLPPTGPCLEFAPGHYTEEPEIPDNSTVYFQSGDYWFDDVEEWLIEKNVHVSAGHPGSVSIPSDVCDAARAADPNTGGTGATFYFGGDSRLRLDDRGSLEMFERQQGNFFVNIQALSAADGYPASNPGSDRSLVRTRSVSSVHLVVRGLVWSPTSRIVLDNPHPFSTVQQLLGGAVTYQVWIGDTSTGGPTSADVVEPASAAIDAVVRLRSTSTMNGVSTTVEAIVQYRPQTDDLDQRVAVNSSRVL